MCREKLGKLSQKAEAQGSPLRVQGKDYCCKEYLNTIRITPACAGKSKLAEIKTLAK